MKNFINFIFKSTIKIIIVLIITALLKSNADAAVSTGINYMSTIGVIIVIIWDGATSFSE